MGPEYHNLDGLFVMNLIFIVFADVLGTAAFKGYINTPIQTLDGIVIQQPK